jgi:ABC-2 type transport system ATP-binding protein
MDGNAIRTEKVAKSYDGKTYAMEDLSLTVPQGAVFGFLGPNGAGKTTTVKLLTGLLKPTKGSCEVLGYSPVKSPGKVHALCGVMTETAHMYGRMTGMQNLIFFGTVFGMGKEESGERAQTLLKQLDLWDARDKKLGFYSTGMAQRLSLARALVGRPRVLFLDEPTSGLDPESAQVVNGLISDLARREGVTVFLCTHQLRYAQDICSGYGIVHRGRMLACGDLDSLGRAAGVSARAVLRLREGDTPEGLERGKDGWWRACVTREEDMPALLKQILAAGHDVFEARFVKPALEDVYFKLVERGEAQT